MKRMPKNGSDHFATIVNLALDTKLQNKQEPPHADKEELAEATKLASQPVKE